MRTATVLWPNLLSSCELRSSRGSFCQPLRACRAFASGCIGGCPASFGTKNVEVCIPVLSCEPHSLRPVHHACQRSGDEAPLPVSVRGRRPRRMSRRPVATPASSSIRECTFSLALPSLACSLPHSRSAGRTRFSSLAARKSRVSPRTERVSASLCDLLGQSLLPFALLRRAVSDLWSYNIATEAWTWLYGDSDMHTVCARCRNAAQNLNLRAHALVLPLCLLLGLEDRAGFHALVCHGHFLHGE